jgi:hypothetical protein
MSIASPLPFRAESKFDVGRSARFGHGAIVWLAAVPGLSAAAISVLDSRGEVLVHRTCDEFVESPRAAMNALVCALYGVSDARKVSTVAEGAYFFYFGDSRSLEAWSDVLVFKDEGSNTEESFFVHEWAASPELVLQGLFVALARRGRDASFW